MEEMEEPTRPKVIYTYIDIYTSRRDWVMEEMEDPTRPTVTCAKPGRRYLSRRNNTPFLEEHCNIEGHYDSPTRTFLPQSEHWAQTLPKT
jgi:hypothetical protein